MSEKRVKVTFRRNGFQTEMRESIAKIYEAKGKVTVEKPKGRPKKAEPKPEPQPGESSE